MKTFDELYEDAKKDKSVSKDVLIKMFKEVLTACFKQFPTLKAIVFAGYTPGWNDGEPCYHSSLSPVLCFEEGILDDEGMATDWLVDYDDDDDDSVDDDKYSPTALANIYQGSFDIFEKLYTDRVGSLREKDIPDLKKLKKVLQKSELPEAIWFTNFAVVAYKDLESGEISFVENEFDIGH